MACLYSPLTEHYLSTQSLTVSLPAVVSDDLARNPTTVCVKSPSPIAIGTTKWNIALEMITLYSCYRAKEDCYLCYQLRQKPHSGLQFCLLVATLRGLHDLSSDFTRLQAVFAMGGF